MFAILDKLIEVLDFIGISAGVIFAVVFALSVYALFRIVKRVVCLCKKFKSTHKHVYWCLSILSVFLIALIASLVLRTTLGIINRLGDIAKLAIFVLGANIRVPTFPKGSLSCEFAGFKAALVETVSAAKIRRAGFADSRADKKNCFQARVVLPCAFVMRN